MYEVLKIIAWLQSKQIVYMGLIKEGDKTKRLRISKRSLDHYLNNLEELIELAHVMEGPVDAYGGMLT